MVENRTRSLIAMSLLVTAGAMPFVCNENVCVFLVQKLIGGDFFRKHE